MQAPRKKTSSGGSSGRRSEESRRQESEEVFEEESFEGSHEEEEAPSIEMPEDERQLTTDDKAARISAIYSGGFRRLWLAVALWVIINVFDNNLADARSKNPHKQSSFNRIVESENMHPDLTGPVLRRWVVAGATWQDLGDAGVDNAELDYSHCREIAKIPSLKGRISVGKRVVAESLTVKETIEAVQAQIAKEKPADASADSELGKLARDVIERLDDPVSLSENNVFGDTILDTAQARAEFNFREQAKIYEKAEKAMNRCTNEKARFEKRLKDAQQSVNFLQGLMKALDGKEADSETAA